MYLWLLVRSKSFNIGGARRKRTELLTDCGVNVLECGSRWATGTPHEDESDTDALSDRAE